MKRFLVFIALGVGAAGCSQADSDPGPTVVRLSVSENGFTPLVVDAHKNRPLTLLVTRESASSCAKQILIPEAGIQRALPLHEEIQVSFTPEKRGSMQYTCCDDMVGGKIVVR